MFGEGVGDGGSGTLMQDDYGTYAEIKSIGGCPAIPHTHALGDLPASRASLRGDISVLRNSARPLCGTAYRLDAAVGGWSRIRALRPYITSHIDSRKSSARVNSARRIRPGKGRRIGKGVEREARCRV